VPGYLEIGSLAKVLYDLRDRCAMIGAATVFVDMGCGEGRPILGALEISPDITVMGFDVDANALVAARSNSTRFASKSDTSPAIHILNADIAHVSTLGDATHAYCFSYGMPPAVIAHVIRLFIFSSSLQYVVLVYEKRQGNLASDAAEAMCTVASDYCEFVDDKGHSLLHMPGQVVHGLRVGLTRAVQDVLRGLAGVAFQPCPPSMPLSVSLTRRPHDEVLVVGALIHLKGTSKERVQAIETIEMTPDGARYHLSGRTISTTLHPDRGGSRWELVKPSRRVQVATVLDDVKLMALVINLERRCDRLSRLGRVLQNTGLQWKPLKAVDGRKLDWDVLVQDGEPATRMRRSLRRSHL
jgi:hypothetical protein